MIWSLFGGGHGKGPHAGAKVVVKMFFKENNSMLKG